MFVVKTKIAFLQSFRYFSVSKSLNKKRLKISDIQPHIEQYVFKLQICIAFWSVLKRKIKVLLKHKKKNNKNMNITGFFENFKVYLVKICVVIVLQT